MKTSYFAGLAFVCLLPSAFAGAIQLGSIQGQDGWSGGSSGAISPSVDQEVTNTAAYQGSQSLRVSNLGYNGVFGGWVFGPGLLPASGQPSSGATADVLAMTLFFRSVSGVADGSNLEIDLGNAAGDDRTTFTAITSFSDANGGLTLRAAETDAAGSFYPTSLLNNNLSRTAWHRLDIVEYFLDGTANDYFQIFLDDPLLSSPIGSPNTSLNRWGTFEPYNAAQVPPGPYNQANRLYLRSGAPASGYGSFSDTSVRGFYVDNVSYRSWDSSNPGQILATYSTGFEDPFAAPEPGGICLFAAGLGALCFGRTLGRRRKVSRGR